MCNANVGKVHQSIWIYVIILWGYCAKVGHGIIRIEWASDWKHKHDIVSCSLGFSHLNRDAFKPIDAIMHEQDDNKWRGLSYDLILLFARWMHITFYLLLASFSFHPNVINWQINTKYMFHYQTSFHYKFNSTENL